MLITGASITCNLNSAGWGSETWQQPHTTQLRQEPSAKPPRPWRSHCPPAAAQKGEATASSPPQEHAGLGLAFLLPGKEGNASVGSSPLQEEANGQRDMHSSAAVLQPPGPSCGWTNRVPPQKKKSGRRWHQERPRLRGASTAQHWVLPKPLTLRAVPAGCGGSGRPRSALCFRCSHLRFYSLQLTSGEILPRSN